jgi:hypothetical protein
LQTLLEWLSKNTNTSVGVVYGIYISGDVNFHPALQIARAHNFSKKNKTKTNVHVPSSYTHYFRL